MNDRQLTGNIGMFYACYRLSEQGWHAMPTVRNAKGADIILVNGARKIGIQVKTMSNENDIPMGRNYCDPSVDYWIIFMNIRDENKRKIYIIPQEDILTDVKKCEQGENSSAKLVHDRPTPDGKKTYWINKKFLTSGDHPYGGCVGNYKVRLSDPL